MTALPDLSDEFQSFYRRSALREPVTAGQGLWGQLGGLLALCAGVGLLAAAVGIWAFASVDHAGMMVRLGASLGLFGAGAAVLSVVAGKPERTRVEIDTVRREIRTFDIEGRGQMFLTGRYRLSEMSDISLRDGTFHARDGDGRVVVSVPVRGRARLRAIRRALALS